MRYFSGGTRLQGGDWVEGYFYKSDINKRERESGKATLIFTPDCDTFMFIPEAHNSVMVIAETVGQYTGLCDRNGKKIFEGDIVRYVKVDIDGSEDTYIGAICFEPEKVGFAIKRDDYRAFFVNSWLIDIEVIGNIYDNPELMGGEANG